MRRLKGDRSILPDLLLGILSLGILKFGPPPVEDVNELFREDGNRSPGMLPLILLSLVTCGLYCFFSWFRLADMISSVQRITRFLDKNVGKIVDKPKKMCYNIM